MGPADFDGIRPLIDKIVAALCKQKHLSCADCDDFRQNVYVALIDDDYRVLRIFEGRSQLSTYLTTVIDHSYYQQGYKTWGKWRPSAEAKRLGNKAILLEQLLYREGFSFSEAMQQLTMSKIATKEEIENLYLRLPVRSPRPKPVDGEAVPDMPAPDETDAPLLDGERDATGREIRAKLDAAIAPLPSQDRLILRMRYWRSMKVSKIAAVLHLDAKKLYKRLDALIRHLERELTRAGVARDDVREVLEHHNLDRDPENGPSSPSQDSDGDLGEGTGRGDDGHDDD